METERAVRRLSLPRRDKFTLLVCDRRRPPPVVGLRDGAPAAAVSMRVMTARSPCHQPAHPLCQNYDFEINNIEYFNIIQ